jgi:hypothetical protein
VPRRATVKSDFHRSNFSHRNDTTRPTTNPKRTGYQTGSKDRDYDGYDPGETAPRRARVKSDFNRSNFRDGNDSTRPGTSRKTSFEQRDRKQTRSRSEWQDAPSREHRTDRKNLRQTDRRSEWKDASPREHRTGSRETRDTRDRADRTSFRPARNNDVVARLREIDDRRDNFSDSTRKSYAKPASTRRSYEPEGRQAKEDESGPGLIPRTKATSQFIFGRNAVIAALAAKRRQFYALYRMNDNDDRYKVKNQSGDITQDKIARLAEAAEVPIKYVDKSWIGAFQRLSGSSPHNVSLSHITSCHFNVRPIANRES